MTCLDFFAKISWKLLLSAIIRTGSIQSNNDNMVAAPPNQAEAYLLACTSIVRELIEFVQDASQDKEINLNSVRHKYGKKYKLKGVPRLVDILSAVPEEWRDRLRGALRAKPVRTASGVSGTGESAPLR